VEGFVLIKELAKKTGLMPHTIRYYEREGLLAQRFIQRGANGYRYYTDDAVERINVIQSLQTAGFTLTEIKDLLERWDGGLLTPTEGPIYIQRKTDEIVKRIDQKIAELEQTKAALRKLATHTSENSHSSDAE
jgi:MerR family transcriptional regulator, copper efflux regulator